MFLYISLIFALLSCVSCVAPASFEDYALARSAINAADVVEARRFSSNLYQRAVSHFRRGQISFKNKRLGQAKEHFRQAKKWAEKAELKSYIKRSSGGGGVLY